MGLTLNANASLYIHLRPDQFGDFLLGETEGEEQDPSINSILTGEEGQLLEADTAPDSPRMKRLATLAKPRAITIPDSASGFELELLVRPIVKVVLDEVNAAAPDQLQFFFDRGEQGGSSKPGEPTCIRLVWTGERFEFRYNYKLIVKGEELPPEEESGRSYHLGLMFGRPHFLPQGH